jgi:hypothetical protein
MVPAVDAKPAIRGPAILWETDSGIRCLMTRGERGRSIEIAIVHERTVLHRVTFMTDTQAADFAIAAMHDADGFVPDDPSAVE